MNDELSLIRSTNPRLSNKFRKSSKLILASDLPSKIFCRDLSNLLIIRKIAFSFITLKIIANFEFEILKHHIGFELMLSARQAKIFDQDRLMLLIFSIYLNYSTLRNLVLNVSKQFGQFENKRLDSVSIRYVQTTSRKQ